MKKEIIKNRIAAVQRHLRKNKADCLIVSKPANVTYLTGFLGHDSWAVISRRSAYLVTDSRYTEQAEKQCRQCKIIQRTGSMEEATAKLLTKQKAIKTITVEASTPVAAFNALKKNLKKRLKTSSDIIESMRTIKEPGETAAIRGAAKIAAKALQQTLKKIKPGLTENELAGILDFQIRKAGATNSFETIIAFGPNASRPHHQPTNRKLRKNDTVLIDFGAKYKGYCCDITRNFSLGRPSRLYKKAHETVLKAQEAAIKMVRPGVDITQVDAAAREVISASGLPVYGHGTGHGLGLEVHEEPIITKKARGKLQPGMIFTIEPAIYIPGKLGVRIEDDILVTKTGCRILTANCLLHPRLRFFL
jgi:Xaa-Pro aminopeptidase